MSKLPRAVLHRLHGLRAGLRAQAGALLVDNSLRGLSRLGQLHPRARPHRHDVEVIRDVPYLGSGLAAHTLDIYRPLRRPPRRPLRHPDDGTLPVVLYVHGGGFRILSKDTHWVMGLGYARRGYLVFNINYRLAPAHRFPAALEDACAAYAFVVQHAARFSGDLSRLIVAGESAGANLVTALSIAACYERPEPFARGVFEAGVVPRVALPACGILQVSDPGRFAQRKRIPPFVEDRIREVSRAYLPQNYTPREIELADPLLLLERGERPRRPLPAFFVPVGTRDPLLPDTRRLKAALDHLGVSCEARYYPGELHAFHALVWREQARACWKETFQFLDRHLEGGG